MPLRSLPAWCSSLLVLGLGTLFATDRVPTIAASWCSTPHAADGVDAEWADGIAVVPGTAIALSVANDAEALYLRLRATERQAQMQLLFGGLVVWIDPSGGEKKAFGIRYPVASRLPAPGDRDVRRGGGSPGRPGTAPPGGHSGGGHQPAGPDVQRSRHDVEPVSLDPATIVPRRLELIGPRKDDVRSLVLDHVPGIEVGLARSGGVLVYELKVPLTRGPATPYAASALPGATIGLGFETGKVERAKPPEPAGGGRPGGGGGGTGGIGMGMPGMRGLPVPDDRPDLPKALKAWTRVALALAPSAPSAR